MGEQCKSQMKQTLRKGFWVGDLFSPTIMVTYVSGDRLSASGSQSSVRVCPTVPVFRSVVDSRFFFVGDMVQKHSRGSIAPKIHWKMTSRLRTRILRNTRC